MYYGCNLNNVICTFLTAIKQAQLFSLNFFNSKADVGAPVSAYPSSDPNVDILNG